MSIVCKKCQAKTSHVYLTSRQCWKCEICGQSISPLEIAIDELRVVKQQRDQLVELLDRAIHWMGGAIPHPEDCSDTIGDEAQAYLDSIKAEGA